MTLYMYVNHPVYVCNVLAPFCSLFNRRGNIFLIKDTKVWSSTRTIKFSILYFSPLNRFEGMQKFYIKTLMSEWQRVKYTWYNDGFVSKKLGIFLWTSNEDSEETWILLIHSFDRKSANFNDRFKVVHLNCSSLLQPHWVLQKTEFRIETFAYFNFWNRLIKIVLTRILQTILDYQHTH